MRRVLSDGSESLTELREFMQGLRGKSPQEVLGDVANSSLVQSTVTAAAGFLVVIIGLSVASYYWNQAFGEPKPAIARETAPAQASAEYQPIEFPVTATTSMSSRRESWSP